jgi:two-component system, sensor histidine kinase PdtaS
MSLNLHGSENKLWKNPMLILIFVLSIGFVVTNIVIYGRNDSQTIFLNTFFNPILAVLVTVLAASLMRQVSESPRARALWLGLVIGWACWTIAEVIWTTAFLKGQEAPYPSLADLFWCIGYFPMYLALLMRSRSSGEKTGRVSQVIIIVISLLIIGFTLYGILLPIIRDYDPSLFAENFLNLFYPLADTFLIILSLQILFTSRKGSFTGAWFWISLGFILSSLSDLFFTYLSGINLYYPEGHANLMSVFVVDIPYTLSYVSFLVGLVTLLKTKSQTGQSRLPIGRTPTGREKS